MKTILSLVALASATVGTPAMAQSFEKQEQRANAAVERMQHAAAHLRQASKGASLAQMQAFAADGQFASGSMGPKVDAVCRFVESTGRTGVITSLDQITAAVAGDAGTVVVPIAIGLTVRRP